MFEIVANLRRQRMAMVQTKVTTYLFDTFVFHHDFVVTVIKKKKKRVLIKECF